MFAVPRFSCRTAVTSPSVPPKHWSVPLAAHAPPLTVSPFASGTKVIWAPPSSLAVMAPTAPVPPVPVRLIESFALQPQPSEPATISL